MRSIAASGNPATIRVDTDDLGRREPLRKIDGEVTTSRTRVKNSMRAQIEFVQSHHKISCMQIVGRIEQPEKLKCQSLCSRLGAQSLIAKPYRHLS